MTDPNTANGKMCIRDRPRDFAPFLPIIWMIKIKMSDMPISNRPSDHSTSFCTEPSA